MPCSAIELNEFVALADDRHIRAHGDVDAFEELFAVTESPCGRFSHQKKLEYFEDVVGVGRVDDSGQKAVPFAERVHWHRKIDAARTPKATDCEIFEFVQLYEL
ncbi:hypothetical protein BpHYR1_042887 [Brachionus plicatilis]|uniref:Uncharacterized protein n=1 Tax=Brachionus plicatilis TaxID=10195 RepID=A0A3M7RK74_BRAPC|nr:hypothetical protein BpHYR1_042887 [Brachionus plicatilis]